MEGGIKVPRFFKIDGSLFWYGELNKDKIIFNVWFRKLENKLLNNTDYWFMDRYIIVIIESYIGG